MIRFYNTLTRKKEDFEPIREGEVSIYSCGPTVYDYAHIGNLRAMVFYDLVRRYLKYKGFKVKHVMNITDVDDKIIKKVQKDGKSLKEVTEFYTKAFLDDLKKLNVEKPEIMPKATEHIKDMVELIQKLVKNGHAYKKSNSVYYKITSFEDYGKLALLKADDLKRNASCRLDDNYEKDDVRDFALWKAYDDSDGDVYWETALGKGRPGWHIECSAMSNKYLGETFDIHLGGVDLVFPHHTNEIAQSEGATGQKFVNYWLHNEHLIVDGKKMSKSLGNFHTLRDLETKWDPKVIRYLFLSAHYRTKLNFTEKALKDVSEAINRLETFVDIMKTTKPGKDNSEIARIVDENRMEFEMAMNDDLNLPEALSVIFNMTKELNKTISEKGASEKDLKLITEAINKLDSILGLDLSSVEIWKPASEASDEVKKLIEQREEFRKKKDWNKADEIRNQLKKMGIILEDASKGAKWRKL